VKYYASEFFSGGDFQLQEQAHKPESWPTGREREFCLKTKLSPA
jgi:hypothetical protein